MATRLQANIKTGICTPTGLPCRILANLMASLNQPKVSQNCKMLTRTIAVGSFLNLQAQVNRVRATLAGAYLQKLQEVVPTRIWSQPQVLLRSQDILSHLITIPTLVWKVRVKR